MSADCADGPETVAGQQPHIRRDEVNPMIVGPQNGGILGSRKAKGREPDLLQHVLKGSGDEIVILDNERMHRT